LDPRARGGNDLIRQGAMLVETAADVLDNLPDATATPLFRTAMIEPESAVEAADPPADARDAVLSLLSAEPTKVDDLVRRCQFSPSAVLAVLLELELAGRVQTLPGSRVALLSDAA
jgi:DNA processing protein